MRGIVMQKENSYTIQTNIRRWGNSQGIRLSKESDLLCYLEFQGADIEDIKSLLGIVGKHVYNKEEEGYVKLLIE